MKSHIPRKRFGQHFLTDTALIESIVDLIDPQDGETLVEIGPGLGAMTLPLLARIPKGSVPLTVIELDRDLAARLRKRDDVEVIESDVLKVDFHALAVAKAAKLRVVGNLPYNISTPILFHLLEVVDDVVDQHFMLQKEVVDRMAAGPGSKDYGRLSVMLQWRYDIESVLDVPPEAFDPPPRVDSAIVRMLPCRNRRPWTACCWASWWPAPSPSAASCCATASATGWLSAAIRVTSTCNAARRKCPSRSSWTWP